MRDLAQVRRVPQAIRRAFCNRSIFRMGGGSLATLPPMSDVELSFAYEHVFERHLTRDALANVATHPKTLEAVRRQREWLSLHLGSDDGQAALTVVEAGCLHGGLLSSFHSLSAPRTLRCFEPSTRFHAQLKKRFGTLNNASLAAGGRAAGGRAELTGGLFNGYALPAGSVDLVLSSHVLEHAADACTWLDSTWHALRPGGHVFTEVPVDRAQAEVGRAPFFHLLFFDEASFVRMMLARGFTQVGETMENQASGSLPARTRIPHKPSAAPPAAAHPARTCSVPVHTLHAPHPFAVQV